MTEAAHVSSESSPPVSPPEREGTPRQIFQKQKAEKTARTKANNQMITLGNGAKVSRGDLLSLSLADLARFVWRDNWFKTGRPNQHPPEGVDWTVWGVVSGRGWGKTLTAAQWMGWQCAWKPNTIGHVIAPTLNDTKHVCFEGPTGLLKVMPEDVIKDYNKSSMLITLDNGSTIRGFSAEEPNRLRGPQCAVAWCDELAAWQDADETWDMMMMGLRLGPHPQVMFTTTPRPVEIMRRLLQDKSVQITRGSTYENRANLTESFFKQIQQYEGTQLGRQELLGELIDPEESGVIKRTWFKLWPAKRSLPRFQWVVLSLDTAFTEATIDKKTGNADFTACSVWGVFDHEGRNNILLLDAWQERLGMPDLIAKVKRELKKAYGDPDAPLIKPLFGPKQTLMAGRVPDIVLIEDKGSGISLRQMLDREGIRAYAYNPGRAAKIQRLHMVSHIFANKMVWLVESDKSPGRPRNWAEPLLAQLCSFTGEGSLKHDDFVDCTTQAIRLLADKRFLEVVPKDKLPDIVPPLKQRINPYAA